VIRPGQGDRLTGPLIASPLTRSSDRASSWPSPLNGSPPASAGPP